MLLVNKQRAQRQRVRESGKNKCHTDYWFDKWQNERLAYKITKKWKMAKIRKCNKEKTGGGTKSVERTKKSKRKSVYMSHFEIACNVCIKIGDPHNFIVIFTMREYACMWRELMHSFNERTNERKRGRKLYEKEVGGSEMKKKERTKKKRARKIKEMRDTHK